MRWLGAEPGSSAGSLVGRVRVQEIPGLHTLMGEARSWG